VSVQGIGWGGSTPVSQPFLRREFSARRV